MTTITWEQLTADEQEALQNVDNYGFIPTNCVQSLKDKGLIIVGRRQIDMTETGREVLAQKPAATEKTVKLKTRSADGLYWEVLYTDGTWADDASEVSHE